MASPGYGHQNISHTFYQGDNGQNVLRKEATRTHTKNSTHTRNIKTMQATQEHFLIKIDFQYNLSIQHREEEVPENLALKASGA